MNRALVLTLKIFGTAWALASILSLVKLGFDTSFVEPLRKMLDNYEWFMQLAFGWAEPWISKQISALGAWLELDLQLNSYWKHVFVVMWLYITANAKTNWDLRLYDIAILTFIWGGIVAVVASTLSGTVSLHAPTANLLVVVYPAIGMVVFELGRGVFRAAYPSRFNFPINTRQQNFNHHLRVYVLIVATCGAATLLICSIFQDFLSVLRSPALVMLAVYVFVLMAGWIIRGACLAFTDRENGQSWWFRFQSSGSAKFALYVLGVMIAALVIVAANTPAYSELTSSQSLRFTTPPEFVKQSASVLGH